MKILNLLLIASMMLFFSCEDKNDSQENETQKPGSETEVIPDISLSADKLALLNNNTNIITFTVKDKNEKDVTSSAKIFVNEIELEGNTYKSSKKSINNVYAKIDDKKSNTLTFASKEIVDKAQLSYEKKTILEDYTATWCGWCPQIFEVIKNHKNDKKFIPIAIHSNRNDPIGYSKTSILTSKYEVTGYPTGIINRKNKIGLGWKNNVSGNSNIAIGINSKIEDNKANIDLSLNFDQAISEKIKVVVYLLENKLVHYQQNNLSGDSRFESTSFYSLPKTINDFEHNHVLRKSATDVLGDLIPEDNTKNQKEFLKHYTINLDEYKSENCEIVAFILYDDNQSKSGVITAQKIKLGESINF